MDVHISLDPDFVALYHQYLAEHKNLIEIEGLSPEYLDICEYTRNYINPKNPDITTIDDFINCM